MEVDREGGDLLRETEQVDGRVEQTGLKGGIQVNLPSPGSMSRSNDERQISDEIGEIRREGGEKTNVSSDLARTVMYSKAAMWMANWIRIESKT